MVVLELDVTGAVLSRLDVVVLGVDCDLSAAVFVDSVLGFEVVVHLDAEGVFLLGQDVVDVFHFAVSIYVDLSLPVTVDLTVATVVELAAAVLEKLDFSMAADVDLTLDVALAVVKCVDL